MEMWPKRQEILKSYLHSDILALGEEELKKFQAEIEATTQKRLRDEFVEECRMLEAEKRFAIRCNADKIHATYEEYFKSAQQELKEKLQVELIDADGKRNTELQKAIVKTRIDTTHDVLRKIRPQMDWVVTSLYNEFEQTRRAQREQMVADFNNIIRKEHLKLNARIKEIEMKKMEELRIQCHEFEMRNFMNVIYIFYMERLRSSSQLQAIYKHFEESSVSSTITVEPMARLRCIAFIIAVNVLMCVLAEEELYPDRFDHYDIGAILNNKDINDAYYNCFMKITECQSEEQKALTGVFSEAYQTNCKKCTEKQKGNLKMTIDWYTKNEPDKWKLIVAKTEEDMKKIANS